VYWKERRSVTISVAIWSLISLPSSAQNIIETDVCKSLQIRGAELEIAVNVLKAFFVQHSGIRANLHSEKMNGVSFSIELFRLIICCALL